LDRFRDLHNKAGTISLHLISPSLLPWDERLLSRTVLVIYFAGHVYLQNMSRHVSVFMFNRIFLASCFNSITKYGPQLRMPRLARAALSIAHTPSSAADVKMWLAHLIMFQVINVSGHRIGTAEVESALVRHKVRPPHFSSTTATCGTRVPARLGAAHHG
jgi:hypothetical protein